MESQISKAALVRWTVNKAIKLATFPTPVGGERKRTPIFSFVNTLHENVEMWLCVSTKFVMNCETLGNLSKMLNISSVNGVQCLYHPSKGLQTFQEALS